MNTKDWKQKELNNLLMEKWGYGKKKEYILDEDAGQRIFAPSHYCAHHVVHEGREAFTIDHNFNESLYKVTKYDLKFEDGSIKRNVHVDELTILKESSHGGKRDKEHPPVKQDEEEIDEGHCGDRHEKELEEKLDPVGEEDEDVNNDDKVNKTDKYLMNRRKAIGKAMKK